MRDRHALIFWMGDIITTSLLEATTRALDELGRPGVNLMAFPDFKQISERFALGKIEDLQFFKKIVADGKIKLDPSELLSKVRSCIKPDARALAAINLLPSKYERWLICEFPVTWFDQLSIKHGIGDFFLNDQVIFLSKTGFERITPDIFDFLPGRVEDKLENCLYFDKNLKRVIAAMNHSFPAVIYVDPSRLEREFVMRNFIDRHQPVHTPPVIL